MATSGGPFGALGDIHGDFDSACRIMARHPDVPFWLSVGDVADVEGRYQAMPAPLYFIKGNNEGFDALASGTVAVNLRYLPNATPVEIDGLRVAGLGGTFAPTWYDTAAAALPHPVKRTAKATALADKRRHFVREEVEACRALERIDVCLTHEAPRPFKVGRASRRARRRSTRCWRRCARGSTCSVIIIGSSSSSARGCRPSGWTSCRPLVPAD